MFDRTRLSGAANNLLDAHLERYEPGGTTPVTVEFVEGGTVDQVAAAYAELVEAGLVEAATSQAGSLLPCKYRLTPAGKQLKVDG